MMNSTISTQIDKINQLYAEVSLLKVAYSNLQYQVSSDITDVYCIRTENGQELVPMNKISYCEAQGNYTKINLIDGRSYLQSYSLKQVLLSMPQGHMIRAHHKYAIHMGKVRFLMKSPKHLIEMTCGSLIPYSRRRKKTVFQILSTSTI